MPKLIIHSPAGTFDATDRQRIAGALMTLGLDCEVLPSSPMVRSTVWTSFTDYAADAVFMGDALAWLPVVTLQIYVLAGGLDGVGKRKLIEGATAILDRRPDGTSVAPVYVVIHEVAEENWGIFGRQADLAAACKLVECSVDLTFAILTAKPRHRGAVHRSGVFRNAAIPLTITE